MKTIGKLILVGHLIALVGIILKMTLIMGGGSLLTFGLVFLSILTFIQFILSLFKFQDNHNLKVISAFMSFTLSISFLGILFRYQWWPGWQTYLVIGTILFVILSIIFVVNRKIILSDNYRKYIMNNLIFPWIFIFVFGGLHYLLSYETFYNTFNYRRERQTYQQFLNEINHIQEDTTK